MFLLSRTITHKSLLSFALPTIFSYVLLNIYFIIDGIFVSHALGAGALAAVNISMPVIGTALALATMLSTGGSALIASMLGAGKLQEARESFSFLIAFCLVSSGILSVLGIVFVNPLLWLLGANADVYDLCHSYTIPLLVANPFMIGGMLLDSFFIVEGNPKFSMLSTLLGGTVNILLDYVFLFCFGLGIEYAAIATGIGYSISALIGIGYFGFRRKGTLRLVWPSARWKVIKKAMYNGISETVVMLSASIIIIVMNHTLIHLAGEDGVAAAVAIQYTEELLAAIYLGYSEGIAPLMSFRQGEGDSANIRRIYIFSLQIIAIFSILTFLSSFLVGQPVIGAFVGETSSAYDMAMSGFSIFAASFLFMGFNTYASSLFTALNDGKSSAILSACHSAFFLISLLVLPQVWGMNGVWVAYPVAEFLAVLIAVHFFHSRSVCRCLKESIQI